MYHDREDLAALISSRICHDLISPLGAISNGLELLSMTGQANSPEFDLLNSSIENANSKIRFFRIAYGRTPHGSSLSQGEVRAVLGDYFQTSRISANWIPGREIQRREAKIAFLAIQCLESALPYGGEITVTLDSTRWHVSADAPKLRRIDAAWNMLTGQDSEEEVDAALVQFAVLAELARFRVPPLEVSFSDTRIEISL